MPTSDERLSASMGRAAILALIAGYVDCYALVRYQVFVSFMSGNTTQAGMNAGQGRLGATGYNLLPIPLFVLGVFLGAFMMHVWKPAGAGRLLGLTAAMLAGAVAAAHWPLPGWLCVVLLSLAMGMMNTTVTRIGGQSISLGFVTGTLNNIAQHLALAARGEPLAESHAAGDTHGRRAALLAGLWLAFLIGACLGGAAAPRIAEWALLPPMALLLLFALWPDWTKNGSRST